MSSLQIIQGNIGYVNPTTAILDQGWSISGIYGVHVSCNAGIIESLTSLGLVVGRQYTFKYTVSSYSSGGVNIIAGTTNGTSRTTNGVYTETLTVTSIAQLSFYSNGNLSISNLSFYDTLLGTQSGATITFNERENKWVSEYSFRPEMMIKFLDQFFCFQAGQIWQHNVNPVHGNFFGVQYPAQINLIVNQDYRINKLWFNLRLDSVGNWFASELSTPPNDQFINGMQSIITSANMKSIDGTLWADILRDMTDPNFASIADPQLRAAVALFQGRMMQGNWLFITLQCNDTTYAEISSAEVYYIDVKRAL